jgi:uncharacterized protein DUF4062
MAENIPAQNDADESKKRYEVFISSTFVDLKIEREKVMQAVLKLECFPAGMELFPAADATQVKVIQRAIDRCDYYVVIVAGRYGSSDESNLSYTEQEFDYAVRKGIPVLAFVHGDPDSIPAGKTDQSDDARKRLEAFRNKVSTGRIRNEWLNPDELAGKVTLALVNAIKTNPRPGWVRGKPSGEGGNEGSSGQEGNPPPDLGGKPTKATPATSKLRTHFLRTWLKEEDYKFDELISGALQRASASAASIDASRQIPDEQYIALVKRCEEATSDMVEIAAETAYFGKDSQHNVLLSALSQLWAVNAPRGGYDYLNKLRAYPALLMFYAGGIAVVAKENYALLRKLQTLRLPDPDGGRTSALILSPRYALKGVLELPRSDGQKGWKVASEHLFTALRAPLLNLPRVDGKSYEEAFSKFEYFNAIATVPEQDVYPYFGRFVWYRRQITGQGGLPDTVDTEFNEQGKEWPPFKAGLFGIDPDAFKLAKASVDKEAMKVYWSAMA